MPQILSGRRLKKFKPKVKNPNINETPPKVNATGNPRRSITKTEAKKISGKASINFSPWN
jgi:hypothetical protein